jgi:ankyrin repeat protein
VSTETANVRDFRGQTPLHINTDTSAKVIDKLIHLGCQVNARDHQGKTALHVASGLQDRQDIIQQLLKTGQNVNVKDNMGRTSLHEAAKASNHVIAQLLISYHAEPNERDICGCTPLHEAALKQDARTVDILLKSGAVINITDINLSTPLHFAAWEDSEKSAEFLLANGANINLKDNLGHTPLDIAQLRRAVNVASLLTCSNQKDEAKNKVEKNENMFALSNCGGQYLSFNTVSKTIEDNEITRKDQMEVQPFLRLILQSPDVGRGCDEAEAREIQLAMEELLQTLAERIGKTDWRFRCSLLHAGSMSEGTKTRCPDEFDFIFVLEEFSKHCYPVFLDIDSETLTGLHIPSNMTGRRDLPAETVKLEDQPSTVERTLSVSVSDYANITINNTVESEPFAKFAGSTIIPVHKMYDGFAQLITKVLFHETFPKNPKLTVIETTLDPAIKLCWRGCRYKDLEIDVDLVPAIVLQEWPEQFQKDNILLTPDILQIPSLVVPKMTAGTDEDLWRCSLAPEESAIFRKLKPAIRNSYVACKALICSHVCPQISFDGYEEVMSFYRMEHDSLSSEESIEVFENAEHIVPSYMIKMTFFAAIASKAETEGIQNIYMDDSDRLGSLDSGSTENPKETSVYGPVKEMYVAEKFDDLDVPLVLDVFKRCAEYIDKRFVPSFFNPKHNVLGARVMEGDLEKVAVFITFIQRLLA